MSLKHSVSIKDVHDYLDFIVTQLASDAAIYFDIHGVHGAPTFIDAHHGSYSYMPAGANRLGDERGQTEHFLTCSVVISIMIRN